MAKLRPSIPDFSFTTTLAYRTQLERTVQAALPDKIQLVARNFARSTASSYWLLKRDTVPQQWLTLRIATHEVWLVNAQQFELLWSDPHDFEMLRELLHDHFKGNQQLPDWFQLSPTDIATFKLLTDLERHHLIWYLRLPETIAAAHKAQRFDLKVDFPKLELMLGDRNNANHQLRPIRNSVFQKILARDFGRNFCFSQFTKHNLLKLLPTNQWLRPIQQVQPAPNDWQDLLINRFGSKFVEICLAEIKADPFRA